MVFRRAKAYIIDSIIAIILFILTILGLYYLQNLLGIYRTEDTVLKIFKILLNITVFFTITFLFYGMFSNAMEGSFGHKLVNISVTSTYGHLTPFRMVIREFYLKHLPITLIFTMPIVFLLSDYVFNALFVIYIFNIVYLLLEIVYYCFTRQSIKDRLLFTEIVDESINELDKIIDRKIKTRV